MRHMFKGDIAARCWWPLLSYYAEYNKSSHSPEERRQVGCWNTGQRPLTGDQVHVPVPSPSRLLPLIDIYSGNTGLLTSPVALYDGKGSAILLGATVEIV